MSPRKMWIPITVWGIYNLQIPLTVADSGTARFEYTHVFLFVCGFQKRCGLRQYCRDSTSSPSSGRVLSKTLVSVIACGIQNTKEDHRKVTDHSREDHRNIAGSATNLILACCVIHLQFTICKVWLIKCRFNLQFAYSV